MPEERIKGHQRYKLIRELAQGDLTHEQLAEKYGKAESSIAGFAKRNAEAINDVKLDVNDEFAGLWVASKVSRIAEYQQTIEDIDKALDTLGEPVAGLIKMKMDALKSVAEELGQLPTKAQLQVEMKQVRYLLEGVDPKDDV